MTTDLKQAIVSVAVATIWTSPESPREIDRPALRNPVDISQWLSQMSNADRLDLYSGNRTQTQILYGTRVHVLQETGEWAKIAVPNQPSPKESLGYPGWMPVCQLIDADKAGMQEGTALATVTSDTAILYTKDSEPGVELSFLTQLPVLQVAERWITVATPHGPQLLMRDDVSIAEAGATSADNTGNQMVQTAKRFLGLHYIWGGVSAFGFDCSGFAYGLHRSQGITIPRDSSVQAKQGRAIERTDLMPGDLLFFANEEGKGSVHHVGMYIGNNQMIHSPDSASSIEIVALRGYKLEKEHSVSRRYW